MMKVLLAIVLVWCGWLGYQYVTKVENAQILVERKADELNEVEFDELLAKVGKGYEYDMMEVDGKKYWFRYLVRPPVDPAFSAEYVDELLVEGRVDYIELIPFTELRAGSSFKLTLKKTTRGRTY